MYWAGVSNIEIYGGVPGNIILTPDDETWYHIALVYDNSNSVFSTYLNGVQMESNNATNDPIVPNVDLFIGDNKYQMHVADQLYCAMQNNMSSICSGKDALETINTIDRILKID